MTDKLTKVLIVDDDEDDFILSSDYLNEMSSHTFSIDWISSPMAALDVLLKNQHDLCLLDYQLGSTNGLTVLRKAIEAGCATPIIMLTGQSDRSLDDSALDAGAADYLIKNEITLTLFTRAIRYALARKDFENERLERIKAEASNRSKDKFLAHLSHELRTPLTSILGYTELLLNKQDAKPLTNELNTILNNGKHLLGLLNNVLDLSKIAANKLELNEATIELPPFLSSIFDLMEITAKDKGLNFTVNSLTPIPQTINNDPVRLRQILINVIHNAIKFTSDGGITINVYMQTSELTDMLCFDVQDTGIGIPESLVSNIFKPFEQIEDVISRNEEGAGLGLAICSELVKLMQGSISVTSEVGHGSCFSIKFPPKSPESQAFEHLNLAHKQIYETSNQVSALQGKVLVVDDIADIRQLIGYFCQSFGLEVDYADNGQSAIDMIRAQQTNAPYDLILMDIHMPKLDGKRAISKIRDMGIKQPILAITAATMKGVQQELKEIGFNDVVAKPIEKMSLYNSLHKYLLAQQPATSQSNQVNDILVVDDDHDAAQITAMLLESLDLTTHTAHTGEQCLAALATHNSISTILLDLNLPDCNGLQLASQISHNHPHIQIIMLTGSELSDSSVEQAGAKAKLLKPVNLQILQQCLDRLAK
ncbi:histidine kinase [Catenovulum agarivorans DS-2]|uniref:histidine kinase n=1 Tax=Catenovulum agarivorans DS-2 TaxID=1328313 RepID=W7QZU4_9ALTE|nr:response regulator [Catenovulum agarivorans]EWH10870.1 histidine kinase [Catenovulum agarivorans DS-2]